MTVRGLALDPVTNAPIVILKAEGGTRLLPIWIGLFEANAIAIEMEKIVAPRPMTHDLLKNMIELLDARMERMVVDNLRENTFFASIYLRIRRPGAPAGCPPERRHRPRVAHRRPDLRHPRRSHPFARHRTGGGSR